MNKLLLIALSAAIFVAAIAHVGQADEYDVYILTGQSNSLGTTGLEGGAPNYESGSMAADTNTGFFWSNASSTNSVFPPNLHGNSGGVFTNLQMQQGDGGSNPHFWGPEFRFARQMANNTNGRKILIIKASRGIEKEKLDAPEAKNSTILPIFLIDRAISLF